MRRLRWPLIIVVVALVVIALLLRNQQSPILQPVSAPVQPASGGVYTEALIGTPGRLNPLLDYYNPADRDVNRLLFSGLIHFDDRGVPQVDLAESWGVSQDGTIYNISIRQDAFWHDGDPVTADDVAFTIEQMRNEAYPIPEDLREFWNDIEVVVIDEDNLQFRLPEAFAPLLDYLTFGVLPKHLLEEVSPEEMVNATFNTSPVGSGPFQFDRFLIESGEIKGVVLKAFDDYYNERPFIDEFVFRYFEDSQTALDAYRSGEVLGISYLSPDVLPQALAEPDLRIYTGRQPRLSLIYFNLDDPELPFFQNESIRRALLSGLNRQRMIDDIMSGQALIADGPIFPQTWAYYEGIERIAYDPEGAIEGLKASGYTLPAEGSGVREKDGQKMAFEIVYPDTPEHAALISAIQRDWGVLGVEVTPKAVPFDALVSDYLDPRTYQAAMVELNLARLPDPDPYPFWDQAQITGGQNYAKWNDRQASEFLEQARITTDIAERTKAYRNFQVRFTQEMPALPLFFPVYSYGVDGQVQGVSMGPLYDTSDRFATVMEWFLLARRQSEPDIQSTTTPSP